MPQTLNDSGACLPFGAALACGANQNLSGHVVNTPVVAASKLKHYVNHSGVAFGKWRKVAGADEILRVGLWPMRNIHERFTPPPCVCSHFWIFLSVPLPR